MSEVMRVLIVDDSTNLRQVIRRYISASFDFQLFEAQNGEEAEQILQEGNAMGEPIQIIMLDWMMPKVSGFEFLKKIRSTIAFEKDPRIIMLTAETYSEQINACMEYGVSSYVTKPFTQEDLAAALNKVIAEWGGQHAV